MSHFSEGFDCVLFNYSFIALVHQLLIVLLHMCQSHSSIALLHPKLQSMLGYMFFLICLVLFSFGFFSGFFFENVVFLLCFLHQLKLNLLEVRIFISN